MEVSSPDIETVPAASLPLKIVVSEAGKQAALKALVAQSIPMLHSPEKFTQERRCELAQHLTRALQPSTNTTEVDELDSSDDPCRWIEEEDDQ